MADSVRVKLQKFITDYRTRKARTDLEYYTKLTRDAKSDYEKARRLYASYADANVDLALESFKAKQEDLENDMQMKFSLYNQIAQQVQMARARIQEKTPAFTQLQPATVPLKKDAPKRMTITLGYMFFAFILTTIYILIKDSKAKSANP